MTRIHPTALALALLSGLYAHSASAEHVTLVRGNTTYNFTGNDVLLVGMGPWGGTDWVMAYDARDPVNCVAYFVVSSGIGAHAWGLQTDALIDLQGGNDALGVYGQGMSDHTVGGPGATVCPNLGRMSPLNHNGHWLTAYGRSGKDILTGGNGFTFLSGGSDGDLIVGAGPGLNSLSGDDGDDYLRNVGSSAVFSGGTERDVTQSIFGAHDNHYGGAGADCISDDNAATYDCGLGTDYYYYKSSTPPGPKGPSTCEIKRSPSFCETYLN